MQRIAAYLVFLPSILFLAPWHTTQAAEVIAIHDDSKLDSPHLRGLATVLRDLARDSQEHSDDSIYRRIACYRWKYASNRVEATLDEVIHFHTSHSAPLRDVAPIDAITNALLIRGLAIGTNIQILAEQITKLRELMNIQIQNSVAILGFEVAYSIPGEGGLDGEGVAIADVDSREVIVISSESQ